MQVLGCIFFEKSFRVPKVVPKKSSAFCIPLVYLWYRKSVLQIRRSEGVRRNALRVLRPNYPHSEEIAQYIEQKTRRSVGHL